MASRSGSTLVRAPDGWFAVGWLAAAATASAGWDAKASPPPDRSNGDDCPWPCPDFFLRRRRFLEDGLESCAEPSTKNGMGPPPASRKSFGSRDSRASRPSRGSRSGETSRSGRIVSRRTRGADASGVTTAWVSKGASTAAATDLVVAVFATFRGAGFLRAGLAADAPAA